MNSKPTSEPDGAAILRSASIKKFGLFSNETLAFSPGLNVFIGRNGCGKSHLTKLLYTLVKEFGEASGNGSVLEAERLENRLASKLAGVFRPEGDPIGRLVRRKKGRGPAEVSATFSNGNEVRLYPQHAGQDQRGQRQPREVAREVGLPRGLYKAAYRFARCRRRHDTRPLNVPLPTYRPPPRFPLPPRP